MNSRIADLPCMEHFKVSGGELEVGGHSLAELAGRAGGTPFFAYDRRMIDARIAELRARLPAKLHLHYAVKANPMPAVIRHMAARTDGLDVASGGELRLALEAGADPQAISFAGPGKRDTELAEAVRAGVTIHLESFGETERARRLSESLGKAARVAVRINPDFELKASGMRMGGGPKPFGVDAEQAPELLRRIGDYGLDFRGFQIFAGSQNLQPEALTAAHDGIFTLIHRLAGDAPGPIRLLNIGGGFGIPYFPHDRPLDPGPVVENLAWWLDHLDPALSDARVVLELGRYLVGEAGIYAASVIDRKVSRDHVYLVTDGGMHHHLAASGNLGQVIRKNYPVAIGNRMEEREEETVSVVGPLCTPLDILADNIPLPRAEPGDLVVVFQSGAYGLSASPTGFLSHPPPAELWVSDPVMAYNRTDDTSA